jgi:hypothetical protein
LGFILKSFRVGLLASVSLCLAMPSVGHAQARGGADALDEIPHCAQNLGTVIIVDGEEGIFEGLGLSSPSDVLRVLVRDSGCFTLIEPMPGSNRSNRTPDFILVAELANELDLGNERTGGVLNALTSNRVGRAAADMGLRTATGGMVTVDQLRDTEDYLRNGGMNEIVEIGAEGLQAASRGAAVALDVAADHAGTAARIHSQATGGAFNPTSAQVAGAATAARVGSRVLGFLGEDDGHELSDEDRARMNAQQDVLWGAIGNMPMGVPGLRFNQLGFGRARSEEERVTGALTDLRRDMGRGRAPAQIRLSLASVPLSEVVGAAEGHAERNDVRRLRISSDRFGGRAGPAYERDDEGKIVSLAMVRSYASLVEQVGGMQTQTPEYVLAARDLTERAAAAEAAAQQAAREEEERARRPARRAGPDATREAARAAAPAVAPSGALSVARASLLRTGPGGEPVRSLAVGEALYPTGDSDGEWVEVLDADDTLGWIQVDRLTD